MSRPFKRVKGTSNDNDKYAVEHNRRPFVFNIADESGGVWTSEGSVPIENVKKLQRLFLQVSALRVLKPERKKPKD